MAITHRIRTAVVPAAGQGTRMLPATKAVPKELLPIIERPAIQFIVDEVIGAGVEHLVIVTSPVKPAIADYFRPAPDLAATLDRQGRGSLADRLRQVGVDLAVTFVHQDEPRGLGHAVGCARSAIDDEPFFVVLPDELMENSSLLTSMAELYARTHQGVVALKAMERDQLSRYGIVTPVGETFPIGDSTAVAIANIVEKPTPERAPSDLAIIGRYLLTPDIFEIIDRLPYDDGEIQLTAALNVQASNHPLSGLISAIGRWDVGHPQGWFEAVVAVGVNHPEIGAGIREWLRHVVDTHDLTSPGQVSRQK